MCTLTLTAALFTIAIIQKQHKYLWMDKQINKSDRKRQTISLYIE